MPVFKFKQFDYEYIKEMTKNVEVQSDVALYSVKQRALREAGAPLFKENLKKTLFKIAKGIYSETAVLTEGEVIGLISIL